jgi:hypothetical protein
VEEFGDLENVAEEKDKSQRTQRRSTEGAEKERGILHYDPLVVQLSGRDDNFLS